MLAIGLPRRPADHGVSFGNSRDTANLTIRNSTTTAAIIDKAKYIARVNSLSQAASRTVYKSAYTDLTNIDAALRRRSRM
jgi:hypothetical protein